MKKWILIAIGAAALAAATTISILSVQLKSRTELCKELKEHNTEQTRVIDSLLNRRMTVFDVQLHVQDKSKFAIYGRYNKGTINVPSVRTYTLEVDSVNMKVK